jgi:uncharacterized MAPEG superfamily protein
MIKRWESASANGFENYPLFIGGVLLALQAKVPAGTLNGLMAVYTLARFAYGCAYILIEKESYSGVRGYCWWTGNLSCLTMMVSVGRRLQA